MSKLPKGWSLVELSNICSINMGQSPKSESYNENNIGLPLIQGNADIKNRKTFPRTYTSEVTKECEIGDIIMTVRAPVGAIAKSYHNACIGRGVCSITPKENNDFLYHFLVGYEDKWDKLSQGSTFTAVNGNDIKKIKLPLPPLEEQKKIADILNTVDKKIAFVEENINATEELKKGLMQKLLTEGIGHTEFKDSELGRIPESWGIKSIEDIAEVKGGKRLPKGSSLSEEKTPYPYIRVTNMFMGGVDLSEIQYVPEDIQPQIKNYTISKNDLFISVAGTLGIVGEVPKELDNANLTENADKLTNIKINKKYLLYILMSNLIQNEISKQTTSNAQPKLALTRIKTFRIPIAPLEEQKQIAEILSTVDNKLENLKEKKLFFQELKKGLMQKLLTGEVRV
ncbi:MAG: restriction endonuclease subunit S [Aliarcobacter sp.]|jgi:type I restriction enzyme S subunit|nr:restriction endonuclease subunit S [Aliarcobacter sp.]